MTAEPTSIGENASKGHNATVRKSIIQNAMREISTLEAQRKEIGEQIREIKTTRIKGDLGMKIADFNIAYRLYGLEREDRDELLTTVRECFDALGVGEQLDWVNASAGGNGAAA